MQELDIDRIARAPFRPESDKRQRAIVGDNEVTAVNIGIHSIQGRSNVQEDAAFALSCAPKTRQEVEAMLLAKFQEIAEQCKNNKDSSTATVAHVSTDNHLTLVHLGDSPFYLFARNDNGEMTPHLLIKPHNVTNRQEVNRLLGAKVGTDGFRKTGMSTRGFGGSDIAGISTTPEVTHVDLDTYFGKNRKIYLCASTDGLYEGDQSKAENFASIISQAEKQNRLHEVPQLLTSYAYGNRSTDNISVIFLEIPRAA